jgi:hypothetical protein
MLKQNWLILVALCALFVSCEREINLTLAPGKDKLVVEGTIEYNNYPFVLLTNSSGFFSKIDLSTIKFVSGANVTVTDLTTGYKNTLIEFPVKISTGVGSDSATLIAYVSLPTDSAKGQINHIYRLDITTNGETYSSITKIPDTRVFDSLWLEPYNRAKPDSAKRLRLIYTDPDTLGNYHRYETQVLRYYKKDYLDEEYLSDFGSVISDGFTNGKTLPFNLDLGRSRRFTFANDTQRNYLEEADKIFPGDTVNIKWSGIDYNTYQYWQTLEYSRNSTGNPFAAPTKIRSNISNGAIGGWCGYGSKIISIIAPR